MNAHLEKVIAATLAAEAELATLAVVHPTEAGRRIRGLLAGDPLRFASEPPVTIEADWETFSVGDGDGGGGDDSDSLFQMLSESGSLLEYAVAPQAIITQLRQNFAPSTFQMLLLQQPTQIKKLPPGSLGPENLDALQSSASPPLGVSTLDLLWNDHFAGGFSVPFGTTRLEGTVNLNDTDRLPFTTVTFEHDLGAELSTTAGTFQLPAEGQLYIRDPEELGRYLAELPTNPVEVLAQVNDESVLPPALAILSPHAVGTDPRERISTVDPLFLEDFGISSAASALATRLGGQPGVRAMKLQAAGLCTNELFLGPLFSMSGQFGQTAINSLGCDKVDSLKVYTATGVPVMRRSGPPQFFLNMEIEASASGFGCAIDASALYNVELDRHGALVLGFNPQSTIPFGGFFDPRVRDDIDVRIDAINGGGCEDFDVVLPIPNFPIVFTQPGMKSIVRTFAFPIALRSGLNQSIRQVQGFVVPDPYTSGAPGASASFSCDPTAEEFFDPNIMGNALLSPRGNSNDQCSSAREAVCAAVRLGFASVGHSPTAWPYISACRHRPPAPTEDDLRLQALLGAITQIDPETGTFAYWTCPTPCRAADNQNIDFHPNCIGAGIAITCSDIWEPQASPDFVNPCNVQTDAEGNVSGSSDPSVSNCTFVPPIRRLMLNPNSLELVFFDSRDDWTNAALAAWYAVRGGPIAELARSNPTLKLDTPAQIRAAYLANREQVDAATAEVPYCAYQRPNTPVPHPASSDGSGVAHTHETLFSFLRPYEIFRLVDVGCPPKH